MKYYSLLFLLLCTLSLGAQSLNGPESVDCDTLTNTWYVGNTGSGKIMRRTASGTWANFISNIPTGPYGIEVLGDRIYACAGGWVRGYNLSDGAAVFSVNTGAGFLNGMTHDDAGYLYASDFSGKKIYKINIADATSWEYVATPAVTPNGMIFDQSENRIVFVTWGASAKIMAISLADSSLSTLKTTTFSNIDGIAMDGQGRYYVAHWGGSAVHRFEHDLLQSPTLIVSGLSQPADIYYNLKSDTLAIPNAGNNTVKFVDLAPVSAVAALDLATSFVISPNPVTDVLLLTLRQPAAYNLGTCQITNVAGQKQLYQIQRSGQNTYQIGLRNLPPGLYYLTFGLGAKTETLKFVR